MMRLEIIEQTFTEDIYNIPEAPGIVVLSKEWSALSREEKTQFQKISDAIRQQINPMFSFDAFQVIHQAQLDLSQLKPMPQYLVYFGDVPKGLGYYEVVETRGARMVLSENLSDLLTKEPSKRKLWSALQQLFIR